MHVLLTFLLLPLFPSLTEVSNHGEQLFAPDNETTSLLTPNLSLASHHTSNTTENANPITSTSQTVVYNTAMLENYAQMNSEYLKRRYKRKHENPEKIRELMAEAVTAVENLRTAIEGKMDAAAIGVLQGILVAIEAGSGQGDSNENDFTAIVKDNNQNTVEDAGDRQRALFKANICPTVTQVLRELGEFIAAYLSRPLVYKYLSNTFYP
jgi:hypothetical protein